VTGGIIYLVTCRATGKCYVGQTIRPLEVRWWQHQSEAKRPRYDSPLHRAILKYGADQFDLRVLEVVTDRTDLNSRELAHAITHHALVPDGYTLKVGNGPSCAISGETRRRMSEAAKIVLSDPTVRARNVVIQREAQTRPEVVQKKAKAISDLWTDAAYRDKEVATRSSSSYRQRNSALRTEEWSRPGARESRSATMKRVANDPDHARNRLDAQRQPATRAKRSAALKAAWADPVKRARILAGRASHATTPGA
jgi:group I intron endonuclease